MDTITFELGFKLEGVYFGYHEGNVYQLPYSQSGRYYALRLMVKKRLKNGWEYYHLRRKKYGIRKIQSMLQSVEWVVNKPAQVKL